MTGKISTITLVTSIAISLVFTTVIIWNLNSIVKKHHEASLKELMDFYTSQQQERIKNEIERLSIRIRNFRNDEIDNTKQVLKERVDAFIVYAENSIKQQPKITPERVLTPLNNAYEWDSSLGYFFAVKSDGTILHDGSQNSTTGQNISALKNSDPDKYSFASEVFSKPGEGKYSYLTEKDTNSFSKIAYAKYSPALGILIGSGVYLAELDKKIQHTVLNSLKDERFGYKNSGYIWIIDTEFNALHHIDADIAGRNHRDLQDSEGKYIFKDMVDIALAKGEGFYEYHWKLPETDKFAKKISYLQYFPEWQWILGSGFYYEKYYAMLKQEEQLANHLLSESIKQNTGIILGIFLVVLFISILIYKRIKLIENSQSDFINDLKQFKTVLNSSSIVTTTDTNGVIKHVNDQFCTITGYTKDRLIGSRHNIISHPDNPKSVYTELWDTIIKGDIWKGILKNMKADGSYFYQKTTIVPFKNKDGEIIRYVSISYDVTELFENKSNLQKHLNADELTGLGNRNSLLSTISNSRKSDLAVLDINGFHRINETYGMAAGDELLRTFSARLKANPKLDKYELFRLHSDVFAIFSYHSNPDEFIADVDQTMEEVTSDYFAVGTKELLLQITIGYAQGEQDLLTKADITLKHAKNNHMDKSVYSIERQSSVNMYETDSQTLKMIAEAISENRVVPFYQKIRNIRTQKDKYECLMRIINRDGDVVPPSEFLGMSKHTRFYPTMTKMVAKTAMDTFSDTDIEFSINVSAEDLMNQDTMDFIYGYALERKLLRSLVLEIVETESITASSSVTETLYRFKLAGTKIAIDDFGTGYSNFDYLLKIKADYVKIDGSIIRLIGKDERARDIVKSIVSYAKKVGMQTIAEFISDAELAKEAEKMGVDCLQGYYIGAPEKKPVLNSFSVSEMKKSG